ncbi:hypothetical protein BKA62DRAFT_676592 [Auriculariales sp. MPI-PUGE-AT-0066]|nr:hypothetical protein BKA62DRAFT_676592 [Auriculariales sp. MPI-PUGE-AT-0066]
MSDSGPPQLAADVTCPVILPDVVVELQRSVNELELAAKALSTKKGTTKEARNLALRLAEHAAELVAAVVAACKERSGALHVLAVSHLTVFNKFISGSSTAGQIQTWSLGIAELGAMLKIDKGVAQLVLDPARCLELSNAKPQIDLFVYPYRSKLNPSTTKVVYDGFKILLEGMANMTDAQPWPWKAIPQTILQFAKLVEVCTGHADEDQTDDSSGYQRSLDIPDKIHDLIREISRLIAMLFNIRKQESSAHQSELTSFVEVFFADMQRIIIRLRVVEKTHPGKAFLLTDQINMIIQDESAKMQRARGNLQTRFVAHTAYTVESILECVIRIQSTTDTTLTVATETRTEVQFVSHVVQETAVGVDAIRTTTDTTHAVVTEIRDKVEMLSREKQLTISNWAKLPARPTFFYGRDDSVNIIVELICTSTGARIAIMGSGGIGKTSLSLIVIYDERVVGVVGDSRYFVSVEGASDVGAAAQLLAGQLGLPESSDPLSAAISYLETIPRALLIVDNLETLLFTKNAAAQKETERMLQRLAGIPTLTLIITSRGAVPPNGIWWSYAPSAGLEAISLAAARETFEEIAGRPELASECNALDTLLTNVDRMPLAVTLLAQLGRLGDSPSELLQQWQKKKTAFIRSGGDDRESSVDISIQISLDFLKGMQNGTEGQQLLSICAHLPDGLRPSVFDKLDDHFDDIRGARSLLVKLALVSRSPENELKMLSPVRHFVLKHHPMTMNHAAALRKIYFDIAASGPRDMDENFSRLAQNVAPEYGNLTSFLLHLISIEEPSQKLFDAIYAVSEYAYWTVPSTTLREAFRQRLDAHPVWLAPCLTDVARTQIIQDEYALAVVNLYAARKLYATLGDKFQEAICGWWLGKCLRIQDSLEAAEPMRDRLGAAQCTQRLGAIQVVLGNISEAEAELQSALAEFEALGELNGTAECAVDLGDLRVRQNDYDSAEKHLATARELFTRIGDRHGLALYHFHLGKLRHAQGRLQDATENFSIAEEIYTAIGNQSDATECREWIAELRRSNAEKRRMQPKIYRLRASYAERGGFQILEARLRPPSWPVAAAARVVLAGPARDTRGSGDLDPDGPGGRCHAVCRQVLGRFTAGARLDAAEAELHAALGELERLGEMLGTQRSLRRAGEIAGRRRRLLRKWVMGWVLQYLSELYGDQGKATGSSQAVEWVSQQEAGGTEQMGSNQGRERGTGITDAVRQIEIHRRPFSRQVIPGWIPSPPTSTHVAQQDPYVSSIPSHAEEETSITDERIERFNDETGPYLFTLASPHLTVGGLIYFSLTLTAAPVNGLVLHNVVGTNMQSHRLKSPKDETVVKPPTHERMLFRLDGGTQFRWPGDVYVGLRSGHRPMAIISIENSRAYHLTSGKAYQS